jgi:hypothetical protein
LRSFQIRFLVCCLLFVIGHTWSPLFFSNQNQYLLHGYALANIGNLAQDWLANTIDPTPLFSAVISQLLMIFGPASIQSLFGVLLFLYAWNLFRIVDLSMGWNPDSKAAWTSRAVIILLHSAIIRIASVQLTGVDYPWYLQSGVAGQYLLGPGLQPSVFGVLILMGLRLILEGKYRTGVFLVVATNLGHSTYLLPSALLSLGTVIHLVKQGDRKALRDVLIIGSILGIYCSCSVANRFQPESDASFQESQRILAEIRIPHHCVISRWFDLIAGIQLLWIALGLFLLRGSRLFSLILIPTVLALILSVLQWMTKNPTFALLFPWRISVFLVPIASAIIFAHVATRRKSNIVAGLILAVSTIGGILTFTQSWGYAMNASELASLQSVKANSNNNEVYLIPTKIPKTSGVRGSMSATFTEPPRPKPGTHLIAVDLQRFRLATQQPIYVDFKSVPYSDLEVLEWYRRVQEVEKWYSLKSWTKPVIQEMVKEGITHAVIPNDNPLTIEAGTEIYRDEAYRIWKLSLE